MNRREQEPCSGEQIEAWDFGPVATIADYEYKNSLEWKRQNLLGYTLMMVRECL